MRKIYLTFTFKASVYPTHNSLACHSQTQLIIALKVSDEEKSVMAMTDTCMVAVSPPLVISLKKIKYLRTFNQFLVV